MKLTYFDCIEYNRILSIPIGIFDSLNVLIFTLNAKININIQFRGKTIFNEIKLFINYDPKRETLKEINKKL